ncbi:MAG: TetR family transcriptional regulator [Calothrix sp. MO_192.B10]|nr:TetR family transcriptional regulator [Calothrix sp. MO_192.B10]
MNQIPHHPKMRRQPKQKRSQKRVQHILNAAAEVFDQVGFEAATMQAIASGAQTAIGSLYQFFPDKLAIFHALELHHLERVGEAWAKLDSPTMTQLPFEEFIKTMMATYKQIFDEPTSRVIFIHYFTSSATFQSIDDSLTQQAIDFQAKLLQARNPSLNPQKCNLIAEVCVQAGNALILVALRSPESRRQAIFAQLEQLMIAYLRPHVGDEVREQKMHKKVMKVMKCPHCHSQRLSKNGHRHGKQCYLCKDCGKQFLETYSSKGYSNEIKQHCLNLHNNGVAFREIERQTGVSHNTVIHWVKDKGKQI